MQLTTLARSDFQKLMTPSEVAEILGVKVQTLAAWRHKGMGPVPTKVGRKVMYHPDAVRAFIDARTATR